jgi:2-hydroxychromene-2-carboxylate isomerase
MTIRFQADADLNRNIVAGVLRRGPAIDFQTAIAAKLEGLPDRDVLAIAQWLGILVYQLTITMHYYHHLLANQTALEDSNLVKYAIALHLDVDRFLHEMTMDIYVARVQADIESGLQSGVIKTPTFFINDVKYSNDGSLKELQDSLLRMYGNCLGE